MNALHALRELWAGGIDTPTFGGKIMFSQKAELLLQVVGAPTSVVITTVRFWVSLPLGIFADWIAVSIWMLTYATFEGVSAFADCRHLKSHKEARDEVFPTESDDCQGSFLTLPFFISFGLARFFGSCIWISLVAGIGWCIRIGYQYLFR